MGITETYHSPQFNMVYKNKDNSMKIMMPPSTNVTRRQDSEKCYNITTIGYASSPEYIVNTDNIFDGKIGCCLIPKERSIDIDDQNDFDNELFVKGDYSSIENYEILPKDLIAFNNQNAESVMPYFKQEIFEASLEASKDHDKYRESMKALNQVKKDFDNLLTKYNL